MVLRIERVSHGQVITIRLSGRLQSEHVEYLQTEIAAAGTRVILDLDEVKLVDREVVLFLSACEAKGIEINPCPRYIREWIARERVGRSDS
jgi:hypothetical protein